MSMTRGRLIQSVGLIVVALALPVGNGVRGALPTRLADYPSGVIVPPAQLVNSGAGARSGSETDPPSLEPSAAQLFGGVGAVVVADGVAYVGSDRGVHALDAATGEFVWQGDSSYAAGSALQIAGDSVYVGNMDGTVRALDAKNGVERWSFDTGAAVYDALAISGGAIYGSNWDGIYFALDAATGELRWTFETNSDASSTPAVVDGIVYFGSGDTNIYALIAATGQKIWSFDTGGEVRSTPVVADGVVYLNSWDGFLYAIEMASGEARWSFDTGLAIRLNPAVVDGVVSIETFDVAVVALDAQTGEEIQSFDIGGSASSSVVSGDLVVAAGLDGQVTAADRTTGAELWSVATLSMIVTAPTVHDGAVYVDTRDKTLFALDAETGQERWRFAYGDNLITPPAFHEELVLIGSTDGNVSALASDTGERAWMTSTSQIRQEPASDAQQAPAPTPVAPATDQVAAVLTLEDLSFEPDVLVIPADQDVLLKLSNAGTARHTFTVATLGIDVDLASGESAEVAINAPPGDYPFICAVPGHDLAGALRAVTVADAGPAGSASPPEQSASSGLQALLPNADELDGSWAVQNEGERTREEVIVLLGDQGDELIDSLGWRGNAFRNFERLDITDSLYEASALTVSIHSFADPEGAADALQPLSEWVGDTEGMESIQIEHFGDSALAFSGLGGRLPTFVLYVQDGNLVIRVGATSLLGDPRDAVIEVTELILDKIDRVTMASPAASGSPVAAVELSGYEGLSAYIEQVWRVPMARIQYLTEYMRIVSTQT